MPLTDSQSKVNDSLEKLKREIAHDLRNPLATARGLAQLIELSSEVTPKLQAHAQNILVALDRMNEIIGLITDVPSGK